MNLKLEQIVCEAEKAVVGKREIIEKLLMAMLAGGHVLLDDVPGVGKTTLARAMARAMGLECRRVQFTPDVLPSDIVGFSMFDKNSGTFRHVPGVVTQANLLLGDEINRTSSKTQSALLEAMEEGQVTVDGAAYPLMRPFCVMATQNQVGGAGTQPLPHAQLDRFLVCLTVGYPDYEGQMELLRGRQLIDPMETVHPAVTCGELLGMQEETRRVTVKEELLDYITRLAIASREDPLLKLGISPRGALSVCRMAKACAYVRGRDYAIPEDVRTIFTDVCAHRVLLSQKAGAERIGEKQVMELLLARVPVPFAV